MPLIDDILDEMVAGKLRGGDKSVAGSTSVTHANRVGGDQTTNIFATS